MYIDEQKLKDFLIDGGRVTVEQLTSIEEKRDPEKQSLGDALVSEDIISDDELRKAEAYILGIPFVKINPQTIDMKVLSLIPEAIARRYNMVAFKKTDTTLEVAMLDINNLRAIDFIKKKVRVKILPRLTDTASIQEALTHYKKSLKAEFDELIKGEADSLASVTPAEETDEDISEKDLQKMADDLPTVKIVDTLISHAILENASDIHIEPGESSVVVRYRIDGILHDAMTLPKNTAPGIVARIKVLSNLKLDEKRLPQDGRFKIQSESENVSFRVSTLPTYYGEKVVIRLLKDSSHGHTLEDLGFHGAALENVQGAMRQTTGMILVSGPTGSGKTTSLYTMLDILNTPDVNISTVEDPIEYQIARINQTQVRPAIGLTFAEGLRSLLRQDPDIIMVGEIRDKETVNLAVNASLTGHLVLSTIHTNSASGAIPRMVDMGVESFLLVSTVRTVIGQRLVRRLCRNKNEAPLSTEQYDQLARIADMDKVLEYLRNEKVVEKSATWKSIPFSTPKEAPECPSGYSGRVGIYEVLHISDATKEAILREGTSDAIEKRARAEGMLTMLEDGIFKAAQGLTTIEEVLRVISE